MSRPGTSNVAVYPTYPSLPPPLPLPSPPSSCGYPPPVRSDRGWVATGGGRRRKGERRRERGIGRIYSHVRCPWPGHGDGPPLPGGSYINPGSGGAPPLLGQAPPTGGASTVEIFIRRLGHAWPSLARTSWRPHPGAPYILRRPGHAWSSSARASRRPHPGAPYILRRLGPPRVSPARASRRPHPGAPLYLRRLGPPPFLPLPWRIASLYPPRGRGHASAVSSQLVRE